MKKIIVLLLVAFVICGCTKSKKNYFPLLLTIPSSADLWGGTAYSVTCDSSDNVYVAGNGYNSPRKKGGVSPAYWGIRKFDSAGTETAAAWSDNAVTEYPNSWNRPYAVKTDASGSVYVAGTIIDGSGTYADWYIMKFDSAGAADTANWNKQFGISTGWDEAFGLGIDSSGNVYVAGYGTNLGGAATGEDWWIKKFSGSGSEDAAGWDKKIDSGPTLGETAQSIVIDGSNNIYLAGISGAGYDLTLKKYNSGGVEDSGNWNKTISIGYDPGIIKNPNGQRLALDSAGNVYYAGSGINQVSGSSGIDWIMLKYSSGGMEQWRNKIGGNSNEEAFAVAVDSSDNVYVVGYGTNVYSATSGRDWWIRKFDSSGNEIVTGWSKVIDGGHTDADAVEAAYSVAVDSGNNVYVVGTIAPAEGGNLWRIIKYSSDGTEVYSK